MAWIESHQELARHPKTRRLARLLGVSVPAVIGHLHCLWWWALDFAQDGDITRYEVVDVAEAALWEGAAQEFVNALVAVNFLDMTGDGCLVLHDWQDYAGKLIERRRSDAERKRRDRAGDGCPKDLPKMSGVRPA